jgi:hypothetical protein
MAELIFIKVLLEDRVGGGGTKFVVVQFLLKSNEGNGHFRYRKLGLHACLHASLA